MQTPHNSLTLALLTCAITSLSACKTNDTKSPSNDSNSAKVQSPTTRDARQMNRDEFDSKYSVKGDHAYFPRYSSWSETDYYNFFVAHKPDDAPINVYYRKQYIDLSHINSKEGFTSADDHLVDDQGNKSRIRHRYYFDNEFDDASHEEVSDQYCLNAQVVKVDWINGKDHAGAGNNLELYLKNWVFKTPADAQGDKEVTEIRHWPTEGDSYSWNNKTCAFDDVDSRECGFKQIEPLTENLCITQGMRLGFVTQLVESDNGPYLPGNGSDNILSNIERIGEWIDDSTTVTGGSIWAILGFAEIIAYFVTEGENDDHTYPITFEFSWGALKRMHESGLAGANVVSEFVKTSGVERRGINVDDYWAGVGSCKSGSGTAPGGTTYRWRQWCINGKPLAAQEEPGDDAQFYEAINQSNYNADLHWGLGTNHIPPGNYCTPEQLQQYPPETIITHTDSMEVDKINVVSNDVLYSVQIHTGNYSDYKELYRPGIYDKPGAFPPYATDRQVYVDLQADTMQLITEEFYTAYIPEREDLGLSPYADPLALPSVALSVIEPDSNYWQMMGVVETNLNLETDVQDDDYLIIDTEIEIVPRPYYGYMIPTKICDTQPSS